MITLVPRNNEQSCSYFTSEEDGALLVALEFNAARTDRAKESFCELLQGAVKGHGALRRGTPRALADFIGHELNGARGPSDLPSWAFFVSVLTLPNLVEVCLGGPHRVHLVRDGGIVGSCREHILSEDAPPHDWPPERMERIDLALRGGIVTRALGKTASRPPETTVWRTAPPYRVIVCSSDAHRGRPPSTYVNVEQGASEEGSFYVLECTAGADLAGKSTKADSSDS